MTKEEVLSNPFLVGRSKLYGCDKYHKLGFTGKGIKVGVIDDYDKQHGYNTSSRIVDELINVAPGVTLKQYDLPDNHNLIDVSKAIKECIVDEIDIISLSISGTGNFETLRDVIKQAYSNNILIVCSAGNTGLKWRDDVNIYRYPAAYEETVSVGCVDNKLVWSDFESHSDTIDLVGFGENVIVRNKDGEYTMSSGTSFSTPTGAGVFALLWDKYRSRGTEPTVSELKDIMMENSFDLGLKGKDMYYGYGFCTLLDSNEFKQVKRELNIITKTIKLQIGNNVIEVDGNTQLLDTAPIIDENNRTLVPLRAIAEALGCEVKWDHDTQTITIIE